MADETAPKKLNKGLIGGIIAAIVAIIVIIVVILLNATPKVVGKYKLAAFIDSDGKEQTEMVGLHTAFGGSYNIEFKKDQTGVLELKGGDNTQTINFTWTDKKVKFEKTADEEAHETDYTYKDDTVTITYDGSGMKFEREKQ